MLSSKLVLLYIVTSGCHLRAAAQPLVYVAPLPRLYNVEIVSSEGRAAERCHGHAEQLLANPTGPLMDRRAPDGLRRTPYFGLEPYVHMNLLNAPFRTLDVAEADLVYVPFYVTMLSYSYRASGCSAVYTKAEEAAIVTGFWDSVDELLPALSRKPHWLALAQLEADVSNGCGSDWGVAFLCDARSAQFIITVPEPLAEYADGFHTFASRVKLHNNVVAVPYFGHLHGTVRGVTAAEDIMGLKSALVAMSFSTHRHESLRSKLMADCHERAGACLFVGLDRAAGEAQSNIPDVMHAYAASWFCAQPAGDTPLRRGLYDCLALGHVLPVLFDELAIDHLPFADLIRYKDFVTTLGGVGALENAVDLLANATSIAERVRMVAALQRVVGVFRYAVDPDYSVVRFEAMHVIERADDAFTASFKAVLRNACSRMLLPAARCSRPATHQL